MNKKEAKKTLLARWGEAVASLRNRLLASPKFQALAAKFPFTRRIARREARALFDLCAGFVYAQTLSACIELNIFESLANGPVEVRELAIRANIAPAKLQILLAAAASLRLLEPTGTAYRLGPLGAALRGNPGLPAMIAHHKLFYTDLADPIALLRGTATPALAKFWPYQGAGEPENYSAIMAATQAMVASEILAAYNFKPHHTVLDAGGGDGSFLRRLHQAHPHLALKLFDLPDVTALADPSLHPTGGDLLTGSWPAGADLITLIRILHDHPDDSVITILANAHAALPPGGTLLIAEPTAGTKGAEPVGAAYFGFYLLAMGSGQPRTLARLEALLRQAGFTQVKRHHTAQPLITQVLSARK